MNIGQPASIPPTDWLAEKIVDGHDESFAELSSKLLPSLYAKLATQILRPIPLSIFKKKGNGPATLRKSNDLTVHLEGLDDDLQRARDHTASIRNEGNLDVTCHDFAALYVTLSGCRPFYVGITRAVLRRLQSHVRNSTHNTGSLFYQLVKDFEGHAGPRQDLDMTSDKAKVIQKWLGEQSVAILPLASPVERYALELYASMELKTGRWNTFETH
jgi:hypothetical protein